MSMIKRSRGLRVCIGLMLWRRIICGRCLDSDTQNESLKLIMKLPPISSQSLCRGMFRLERLAFADRSRFCFQGLATRLSSVYAMVLGITIEFKHVETEVSILTHVSIYLRLHISPKV